MSNFFTAPDGADEPTIWERADGDPAVVVRRAELPGPRADLLWRVLTGVLTADDETVERVADALRDALDEREEMHERTCPAGCGCRYMTADPDARDCACDGPCCMDPDWFDERTDAEVATRAALTALTEGR